MTSEVLYGPVSSWRLGKSLGVDIICSRNICTYNCIYCQLGPSEEKTIERRVFVPTEEVISAVRAGLPEVKDETEVVTISGTGEPTLAKNLGDIIDGLHRVTNFPIAVLTNGSLFTRKEVREEVGRAELIIGSLDAGSAEVWSKINQPHPELNFNKMVEGLQKFSVEYEGFFGLEVMFTPVNTESAGDIARLVGEIQPDEVQINTPTRGDENLKLSPAEVEQVIEPFLQQDLKIRSVYKASPPRVNHLIGEDKLKHLKRPDG